MKINNKKIWIVLFSALILISVYAYSARGALIPGEVSGYLILMDQKLEYSDYALLRNRMFSSIIFLPSDNCEGIVNYCSYGYKDDVDSRADINNDGKIDITDVYILTEAFGCSSGNACWNEPVEDCFFTISGRKFRDPTHDCYMNQSDSNLITNNFGKTNTNPLSTDCENRDECKADVNKDGRIDIFDAIIVSSKFGQYADVFERYIEHKSQADVNKDGTIDILDAILISGNYGEEAIEQKCISSSITHLDGKKYKISASGRGLYYTGVSYRCIL